MAIRTIITDGDPVLRKICREITVFDSRLHTLLDDMLDTLHNANGVGLAAIQVGVLRRAVIVEVDPEEGVIELINPRIIEVSEETQSGAEGCLSFPGEYGIVERPMRVTVEAMNRNGDLITVSGEGLKARAFCHEVDHLDGKLFKDIATEILSDED